ncbi:hypothetical protein [Paenibacillus monticola]|uniref:Uncharacterized protein n=1 Tax=Paenibacillus monticola TaxID=2666075 RepID=A0A7X2HBF1_9BACL|nr:hypothetical protein [Paenibacillus monticola]MRN56940.1 hypothetical protein [Paenibacillus monticola]
MKRSVEFRGFHANCKARLVKHTTPQAKTVVVINKYRVKLKVTNKLPILAKNTILFIETKRQVGTASRKKRQRLKELNEAWYDMIKSNR